MRGEVFSILCLRMDMIGHHWLKLPALARHLSNHLLELSQIRSPVKECRTNKLPLTGRIQERSKGERRLQPICPTKLPESFSLESILADWCVHHQKGPWVRMTGQKQTLLPLTRDCEPHGRVPLSCCSLPGCPFPMQSPALLAHVSSDNSFLSVRQKPTLGPWKGSHFCNNFLKT